MRIAGPIRLLGQRTWDQEGIRSSCKCGSYCMGEREARARATVTWLLLQQKLQGGVDVLCASLSWAESKHSFRKSVTIPVRLVSFNQSFVWASPSSHTRSAARTSFCNDVGLLGSLVPRLPTVSLAYYFRSAAHYLRQRSGKRLYPPGCSTGRMTKTIGGHILKRSQSKLVTNITNIKSHLFCIDITTSRKGRMHGKLTEAHASIYKQNRGRIIYWPFKHTCST